MLALLGSHTPRALGGVHNGSGEGVYACRVEDSRGTLSVVDTAPLPDPTWLALLPAKRLLYAASHTTRFEGQPGAGITAFSVEPAGRLHRLNSQRIPHPHVTHIALDKQGRFLFAASSQGGAVSVIPIKEDGSLEPVSDFAQFKGEILIGLGEVPEPVPVPWVPGLTASVLPRYEGTTIPHSVRPSLCGKWVLVADMAASGIGVLGFDSETGKFTSNRMHHLGRRAGPRIIEAHPNGHTFYSVNELDSTLSVFELDPVTGDIEEVQYLPSHAPTWPGKSSGSGIVLDPTARFLWTTNRHHNSVSTFQVEPSGRLVFGDSVPSGADFPWHISITPDGRLIYVCHPLSKALVVFAVDRRSGALDLQQTIALPAISSFFLD